MTGIILPEKYKEPINYAVAHSDKRLLNCIELELIKYFGIAPNEYPGLRPIAIGEKGNQLLVKWLGKSCACEECYGTGFVYACGLTREFEFECPVCDGDGELEAELPEDELITNIDGEILNVDGIEKISFDDFFYKNPLIEFEKKNKKQKAEEVSV